MKTVSIVAPVYNEEPVLTVFYQSLSAVLSPLPYRTEIIFVNDGSSDGSEEQLNRIAENDHRVRALHLSRNFGHQAALCAGLDAASGDYVVTLDSDGQLRLLGSCFLAGSDQ